jgi:hypothetical protein
MIFFCKLHTQGEPVRTVLPASHDFTRLHTITISFNMHHHIYIFKACGATGTFWELARWEQDAGLSNYILYSN